MLVKSTAKLLKPVTKVSFPRYIRRRAFMYVPGDDPKKLNKMLAPEVDVDCIVMDCEDGVAQTKKPQARTTIREILDKGKPQKRRNFDLAVRINSLDSGFITDDLETILGGRNLPDTIVLPKIKDFNDVKLFSAHLDKSFKVEGKVDLIMGIESALALININDVCSNCVKMQNTKFLPAGIFLGSDDFCASIGASRSESNLEVLYARQKLIVAAKAFNLQAIDMVYIAYSDLEGLKRQAFEGARMGFTGKQIIHPGQVDIVQEAFFPSKAEVEWAAGLLKAFHQHQRSGKGAFTYQGSMIDMPTMRQAQNVIDLVGSVADRKT